MVFRRLAEWIGRRIVRYLDEPISGYRPFFAPDPDVLKRTLMPGDVLLVEGANRISSIIKYLTQSTWSHAAIYVGEGHVPDSESGEPRVLVEALAEDGVIAVPLSKYAFFNTRICRPVGLSSAERERVVAFALAFLGRKYDIRYVLDLARYLVPYPPVPVAMRRRMLALGSGDPTRAICSTMIAQAFHSISYPILPDTEHSVLTAGKPYGVSAYIESEALHIRREGLFTPRDFDISPYFELVKPTIENGFDFHRLAWVEENRPELMDIPQLMPPGDEQEGVAAGI